MAVLPAPGGPQSSVTLPLSKPPPKASSKAAISVYALLGGWSSSDRTRKASDAETVGRRSVANQSLDTADLCVADEEVIKYEL